MTEPQTPTRPADETPRFDVGEEVEVRLPLGDEDDAPRVTWELAEVTETVRITTEAGQHVYVYEVCFLDNDLDGNAILYGAGEVREPLYEPQACRDCGCEPGERFSNVEGDGTWALMRQCECDCHAALDD